VRFEANAGVDELVTAMFYRPPIRHRESSCGAGPNRHNDEVLIPALRGQNDTKDDADHDAHAEPGD
jgi:hypothetical protein